MSQLRHEQTKAELLQQLAREQMLHKEDQAARATCEAQLQTMDAELHDVRKLEADRRERDSQVPATHFVLCFLRATSPFLLVTCHRCMPLLSLFLPPVSFHLRQFFQVHEAQRKLVTLCAQPVLTLNPSPCSALIF